MAQRFRPITVEGRRLRWRFNERLVVIPAKRSGPQLYVSWRWQDWLGPVGAGAQPQTVTPRFVAEAVRFALGHGWQPEINGPPIALGFESGRFRVVNRQTGTDG